MMLVTEDVPFLSYLRHVRYLLEQMDDGLRPETEYLRDELRKLQQSVDTLEAKVTNEGFLNQDKEKFLEP